MAEIKCRCKKSQMNFTMLTEADMPEGYEADCCVSAESEPKKADETPADVAPVEPSEASEEKSEEAKAEPALTPAQKRAAAKAAKAAAQQS